MDWTSAARLRLAHCGVVRCEPGWSWAPNPKQVTDYDLWFVWAGLGQMRIGEEVIPLVPGRVFCLRPGSRHRATHDPRRPLGVSFLHFDFVDRRGRVMRLRDAGLPPLHRLLEEVDHFERILRRAVRLAKEPDRPRQEEAATLVRSVLHAMDAPGTAPATSRSPASRVVREVAGFIDEHPGRLWSLQELARRAGYGVDHFARTFKSTLGVTPGEYCIRARIERARVLLESSDMTISEVARVLGYADVFFFSRQFKERTGLPPSEWRTSQTSGSATEGLPDSVMSRRRPSANRPPPGERTRRGSRFSPPLTPS